MLPKPKNLVEGKKQLHLLRDVKPHLVLSLKPHLETVDEPLSILNPCPVPFPWFSGSPLPSGFPGDARHVGGDLAAVLGGGRGAAAAGVPLQQLQEDLRAARLLRGHGRQVPGQEKIVKENFRVAAGHPACKL